MPSVQSSPRTPTRRRRSSAIDVAIPIASPIASERTPRRPTGARRDSQKSIDSFERPWLQNSVNTSAEVLSPSSFPVEGGIEYSNDNGLGSLADELAEAEEEDEPIGSRGDALGAQLERVSSTKTEERNGASTPTRSPTRNSLYKDRSNHDAASVRSLSPLKQWFTSRHKRQNSQYDGSDYGDESDFESEQGFSSTFESKIATIESLARRSEEASGNDTDEVIKRFAGALKELPSQSGIENGASRLMTSHSAITTHITHQTRTLTTLTHPLVSPLSIPPEPNIIDDLLTLLTDLLTQYLPHPPPTCLTSLHSFRTSTADIQTTLTSLSDTIYMTRQTALQTGRKLKTASDLAGELRRETDAREEGVRWIENGGWEERLAGRQCAEVCRDVVSGFEDVCDGWRSQLLGTNDNGNGIGNAGADGSLSAAAAAAATAPPRSAISVGIGVA